NAAKAIVRSVDSLLMEAVRRASPVHFGLYAKTLPPAKMEPTLIQRQGNISSGGGLKRIFVSVSDLENRAIEGLKLTDFEITENGDPREILSMGLASTPFNLVLLLDVSGSIENYVNFIRKAARSFVNTVEPKDRVSIVTFSDDVKTLSALSTDKHALSKSVDTFEAGGGTAYYDAMGYALTEIIRPLKGERTAIVILTDGDDNRSFLPFETLLGSIQESGALIYPLYVPSGLIAASAYNPIDSAVDPLRSKYMGLAVKVEGEGEKLAEVSGGRYYSITQLSQIQTAYDDIVRQLRTAYALTFRSGISGTPLNDTMPRLKVRVKRTDAFVKMGAITEIPAGK
ncbi:MAG: VWA domain-containing protein, partial [Pyrinomonadaceae bacterium]